jgi:hypothetical protein
VARYAFDVELSHLLLHAGLSRRFPPVRSSPRLTLPDGTRATWALPRASHPALTGDARRGGDRPSSTDPKHALCHRPSLQTCVVYSKRATSCRTRERRTVASRSSVTRSRPMIDVAPAAGFERASGPSRVLPSGRTNRGGGLTARRAVVGRPTGARDTPSKRSKCLAAHSPSRD